ncbi:MAG: DNA-binding response regulator [Chitinophagaceae bacterium]|nr:DNA-binding response regulator [Chitinophagaceae bacterium]
MIKIGIIDDHQLFVKSLSLLLTSLKDFAVTVESLNVDNLEQKLRTITDLPDIMLIDVNMPVRNGVEAVRLLNEQYPSIKLVALSMDNDDLTIIKMIKAGCCAYLLKDTHPDELEKALLEIHAKGFYNGDASNINYRRLIMIEKEEQALHLNEKEKTFLQHACSEKTYKQIASDMNVSERTIDSYREALFHKLKVQSRVGLCLEALRKQLVIMPDRGKERQHMG